MSSSYLETEKFVFTIYAENVNLKVLVFFLSCLIWLLQLATNDDHETISGAQTFRVSLPSAKKKS